VLLAEEHQRVNPLKSLMQIAEELELRQPEPPAAVRKATAEQNDAAMAQLGGMMAGVRKKR
jgi:hypothetical protein